MTARLRMGEEGRRDVRREIEDAAKLSASAAAMNALATVIAAYGLLANSPAVVIGAMIVAQLLNPILGLSLGLAESDHGVIRRSAVSLLGGFLVVYTTALVIGVIHRGNPITAEILARTEPGLFDLVIALAGGTAGAYATVSPKMASGFIGVAIATALVPPLTASGLLLARGEVVESLGALLLAGTNIVAIQLAASVVLWAAGFRGITRISASLRSFLARDAPSIVVVLALAVVFSVNLRSTVTRALFETAARGAVKSAVASWPGAHLVEVRFDATERDKPLIVRAVTRAPSPPSARQVADLERDIQRYAGARPIALRVRSVQTVVVNRDGVMFTPNPRDDAM